MKRASAEELWTPKAYNRIAAYYDLLSRLMFPIAEISRRKVVEDLTSGSILDVGCGTGTLLAMASANGLRCYGIDTSPGMLDRARAKTPDAEFLMASYYDIPYADGCFDTVVETNALGGAGINVERALSEMLRVCKRGGEVRIADYALPPQETWINRILKWMGSLAGDYPRDYRRIFRELGCEPEIEILGGADMYQFFLAKKP